MNTWTKFIKHPKREFDIEKELLKLQLSGCTPMNEKRIREALVENERLHLSTWENNIYVVQIYKHPEQPQFKGWPPMLHLSIKRIDIEPIRDWRDMQRIKNEIVGPEHEAVELYPSEKRLVDGANQYHLWVFKEPGLTFPFGFRDGRQVSDVPAIGGKQRPRS